MKKKRKFEGKVTSSDWVHYDVITFADVTPKGLVVLKYSLTDYKYQDLTERALEGTKKYGEPLKAFNSRSAPIDALQEVYDLAMYLRQDVAEREIMAAEVAKIAEALRSHDLDICNQLMQVSKRLNPLG